MRERDRNLAFRRIRFHIYEKDGILLTGIAKGSDLNDAVYTRIFLKEQKRLLKFLKRAIEASEKRMSK